MQTTSKKFVDKKNIFNNEEPRSKPAFQKNDNQARNISAE